MPVKLSVQPALDTISIDLDIDHNRVTNRVSNGLFALGNKMVGQGRPKGSKNRKPTAASLRDLCLETLHKETDEGIALISEMIERLAKTKPDKALDFAKALLPKESTSIVAVAKAPIVFNFDPIE